MAQAAAKKCDICLSAPLYEYCLDCGQYFCKSCKGLHMKMKTSKNHQFQNASNVIPEAKHKCKEHNEDLSLLCTRCDVVVCISCVTGKHNGHKLSKIQDSIEEYIKKTGREISSRLEKFGENIKKMNQEQNKFESSIEFVIKAVQDQGIKLKVMVDRHVDEMVKNIREKSNAELRYLAEFQTSIATSKTSMEEFDQNLKKLQQTRQDGSVLHKLKSLNDEVTKIEVQNVPSIPTLTYSPDDMKMDAVKRLIGTYQLRSLEAKKKYETHGNLWRCSKCGYEKVYQDEDDDDDDDDYCPSCGMWATFKFVEHV